MRIAVATCASEVDPDAGLLLEALETLGVEATLAVWDDGNVDWDGFDLTVVRSTWDYTSRRDEFLAWARSLAHVANPYEALAYSSDKHYLFDLARRGFLVVPSRLVEVGETGLVFLGGEFSHAMVKAAMLNVTPDTRDRLYRAERMSRGLADPAALALAKALLEDVGFDLTYARVDLVSTPEGWAVMELELVEPSLFLAYDEGAPARLARALVARAATR